MIIEIIRVVTPFYHDNNHYGYYSHHDYQLLRTPKPNFEKANNKNNQQQPSKNTNQQNNNQRNNQQNKQQQKNKKSH